MVQDNSMAAYEAEILKKIERSQVIFEGLQGYTPFLMMLDDFKDTIKSIDDGWHLFTDINKLNELRITKFAAVSIINVLDNYKHDLVRAQEELVKLQNPDKIVNKDYDGE